MRDRLALSLAVLALVVVLLQSQWQSWRLRTQTGELREQLNFVTSELAHLQKASLPPDAKEDADADPARLAHALDRLGSRDIVKRYQAGLTVREFGDEAVPALLELAEGGDARSRESALLLLAQLDAKPVLPDLRELAGKALMPDRETVSGEPLGDSETAALLAILARHADAESLPLFQAGLAADAESVRGAAVLGARRLSAPALVPALAARLGKERHALAQQIEQTLCQTCRAQPTAFREQLATLPPKTRYEVGRVMSADPSASTRETLRELSHDPDQRVAIGAARFLALSNDPTARPALKKLVDADTEAEVRSLAESLLHGLDSKAAGQR